MKLKEILSMKKSRSRVVCISAAVALSFLLQRSCFAQDKAAESLDKKISQAESAWGQGNPNEYYARAAEVAREIKTNPSKTSLSGPATKLLGSLLAKQANPKEIGVSDLSTMQELASFLASHDEVPIEARRSTVSLLCEYLGKVRKERIPNFTPKPVVANVAPPPNVPGFAGMNPDAIKDPSARAAYEAAIRENDDNERQNARQRELRRNEWAMRKKLRSYLLRTFKASDVSTPALDQCINDAGFDDQERKEIESQLK